MGTNFESAYHLSQLGYPLLKASGRGSIVFISSVAGVMALPVISIYAASKGMLHNEMTKLIRIWYFTNKGITNVIILYRGNESSHKKFSVRVGRG